MKPHRVDPVHMSHSLGCQDRRADRCNTRADSRFLILNASIRSDLSYTVITTIYHLKVGMLNNKRDRLPLHQRNEFDKARVDQSKQKTGFDYSQAYTS